MLKGKMKNEGTTRNSSFGQLTYEEALAKKTLNQEKNRDKPRSTAARAGRKRTEQHKAENNEREIAWKLVVRIRDGYRCQYPGCKVKEDYIHCHHVAPRSQRKDLIYVESNGKCLCSEHHTWVHDHPVQAIEMGLLSNRSRELASKEGTLGVY